STAMPPGEWGVAAAAGSHLVPGGSARTDHWNGRPLYTSAARAASSPGGGCGLIRATSSRSYTRRPRSPFPPAAGAAPLKLPAFVTRIPRVWGITVGVLFVVYT